MATVDRPVALTGSLESRSESSMLARTPRNIQKSCCLTNGLDALTQFADSIRWLIKAIGSIGQAIATVPAACPLQDTVEFAIPRDDCPTKNGARGPAISGVISGIVSGVSEGLSLGWQGIALATRSIAIATATAMKGMINATRVPEHQGPQPPDRTWKPLAILTSQKAQNGDAAGPS